MFATDPQVIAVRAESKIHDVQGAHRGGQAEPGTIAVGITGPTGTARLAFHIIERETGTKFKYVSYKGGGEAVLATLGGHVEVDRGEHERDAAARRRRRRCACSR